MGAFLTCAALVAWGCGGPGESPRNDGSPEGGRAVDDAATAPAAGTDAPDGAGTEVRGRAPAATRGIPSVVMLTPAGNGAEPDPSHPSAPRRGDDASIDQFGLAFSPRTLVVAAGEGVRFTNSEGALTHNVHVRSIAGDSTIFNDDAGPGEGSTVSLPDTGGYDVLCDMHPGMAAFVFVTSAPYAVAAETDGTFTLGRLAPGDYVARVWTIAGGFGPETAVHVTAEPASLDLTGG